MSSAPTSQERVLSTLNKDGSRFWLRPRLSRGRFLLARRIVAYLLIAVFTLIPYININGRPAVLLDIVRREFTIFGFTFLPTDTLLLALFMMSVFIAIILATALFGRVWCGWACPQTVYMEFLFRPVERLFDGKPGSRTPKKLLGLRTAGKYLTFLVLALFLAHTFLAYFVGVEQLIVWVRRSPLEHPTSFLVMAAVTGLMLFDFGFFREQVCIVACPYGRFQSVMLDRNSLIISYDRSRGEPRGKVRRSGSGDESGVSLPVLSRQGDCIDCRMCVTTCPTGIDIREGLQMECIGCAQCIDACDTVMDRIKRPRGLIRYSSQAAMEGEPRKLVRPRVVVYPALLLGCIAVFIVVLSSKGVADVTLLRGLGRPFVETASGEVANQLRVKITNRSGIAAKYNIRVSGIEGVRAETTDELPVEIASGASRTVTLLVVVPRDSLSGARADVMVEVSDGGELSYSKRYPIVGPSQGGAVTREDVRKGVEQ